MLEARIHLQTLFSSEDRIGRVKTQQSIISRVRQQNKIIQDRGKRVIHKQAMVSAGSEQSQKLDKQSQEQTHARQGRKHIDIRL